VVGRETILREAILPSQDKFDYCFIDCAPSLGLLTLNALAAAEEVLIPLQPHFLALQGFGQLLQTIELVNKRINPDLKVKGILLCMFDSRASLPNEVRADIEEFLNNARGTDSAWSEARILPTYIRRNIKLAEAPSYGKTIFEYEPNCHGAEDYKNVAEFVHTWFELPEPPETPPPVNEIETEVGNPPREHTPTPDSDENQNPHPAQPCPSQQPDTQVPSQPDTEPLESSDVQTVPPLEIRSIAPSDSQVPTPFTQTPITTDRSEIGNIES
jgi:chromosome partitioning protein